MIKHLLSELDFNEFVKEGNVVVESMYSWSEYKFLKDHFGDAFKVLAVVTDCSIRRERLLTRVIRPMTYEQSISRDYAEIENIEKAQEIVSTLDNENASLCYGYEKGAIKSFEYTLEGGVLVFTTTSLLNNLCVTGANLDSLITNPLFWVACVLALILL